jgi:hypothetical protein
MVTSRTTGHADRIGDRAQRRQRIDTLTGRPSPWTFAEWLEWAEAVAADKLARGESFLIAAQASHPNRARSMTETTTAGRYAFRWEIGARAAHHAEEAQR